MSDLELKLKLLQMEVDALRSVLSEYDCDHSIYTQWIKAEAIRAVLESIK